MTDVPVAELPAQWALALADPIVEPRPRAPAPVGDERARRYAVVVLEREVAALAARTTGRNCALTRVAFRLGQFVSMLTVEEIEEQLVAACEMNGALKEHGLRACVGTIRRGVSAGAKSPRGQRDGNR